MTGPPATKAPGMGSAPAARSPVPPSSSSPSVAAQAAAQPVMSGGTPAWAQQLTDRVEKMGKDINACRDEQAETRRRLQEQEARVEAKLDALLARVGAAPTPASAPASGPEPMKRNTRAEPMKRKHRPSKKDDGSAEGVGKKERAKNSGNEGEAQRGRASTKESATPGTARDRKTTSSAKRQKAETPAGGAARKRL